MKDQTEKNDLFNDIINNSFVELSLAYARAYEKNPRNFINCYKKHKGIRMCCNWIVFTYKYIGAFDECKQLGKDFTEWANRQKIKDDQKKPLAELILIFYSIIHK
ncbi:MAG: hypothetical protein FJY17_00695 [Bacteroidetes bacterium]|nr:hypothetical protein [Bacteroidota bacterium]